MVTSVYRFGYDAGFPAGSPISQVPAAPDLLVELYQGEPEIVGHPAVAVFLGLGDPLLVGGARFVFAPEIREYAAEARVSVTLVVGVDGQVALQDRRLVFVTSGLLVFVCQGQQPRRVVGVVGQHPLEIIYPVVHQNPPWGHLGRQYISISARYSLRPPLSARFGPKGPSLVSMSAFPTP